MQATSTVYAPIPAAPAPAATVSPYLFVLYNDTDPTPKKPYLYYLEYPLICAAG